MTRANRGAAVKQLEKEGKLSRRDGRKLMRDAVKKYESTSQRYAQNVSSKVDELVKERIKASPFATKEDLKNLTARVDKLSRLSE